MRLKTSVLIAVLAALLLASIGASGVSHAASWNFEVVETPPLYDQNHFYESSLAVDSSGRPHVTVNDQWDFVYGRRWFGLALDCGGPSAGGNGIKVDVN